MPWAARASRGVNNGNNDRYGFLKSMEQGSPPPNVTSSSTATKRRRMSIVDESNILSDPHRKRKRAAVMDPTYTPHDEVSYLGGGSGDDATSLSSS